MAEMGYGYGSEFQLMRFLGRHRISLEKTIREKIRVSSKEPFHWLDFEFSYNEKPLLRDSEIKGLSFLQNLKEVISTQDYKKLKDKYNKYNINGGKPWQHWDALFTIGNTIYFVEAKAHVEEMYSLNKNGGKTPENILNFMREQFSLYNKKYGTDIDVTDEWMKKYYQLANRLAITAFLVNNNISAKTICIYFTNGYSKKIYTNGVLTESVDKNTSEEEFGLAIEDEMVTLGIKDKVSPILAPPVFFDANPKKRQKNK